MATSGASLNIATLTLDPTHDNPCLIPTVNCHEISVYQDTGSAVGSILTFDELPGTYHITKYEPQGKQSKATSSLPKSYSKVAQVSHVASYDAATFLSCNQSRPKTKKSSQATISNHSNVSIEHEVLVLGRDENPASTYKAAQYHAFKFSFPTQVTDGETTEDGMSTNRQLLMIRQPGLQRSGPMSLSNDLESFEAFDVVEICTGMCLFSEEDLRQCTRDGTIQPSQLASLPVSICEKEIIARLSTTVANTAASYLYGKDSRRICPLRINIDIPSVQYYKDALDSFDRKACGPTEVLKWIAAIQNRRLLLFDAFSKAIGYGLSHRGLSEENTDITLSCGLKLAHEMVYCKMVTGAGSENWIQEILDVVLQDKDELWIDFVSTLSEEEQNPSTWREFHTLSYMYEVAKPALRARSEQRLSSKAKVQNDTTKSAPPSPPPGHATQDNYFDLANGSTTNTVPRILLLAIDDFDEGRIYTKAYQALCRLSTSGARSPGSTLTSTSPIISRILTICPAPQVVVGRPDKNPDWIRSSLWRAALRTPGTTPSEALQFRTSDGAVETENDVLKRVYDRGLVSKLETWLQR